MEDDDDDDEEEEEEEVQVKEEEQVWLILNQNVFTSVTFLLHIILWFYLQKHCFDLGPFTSWVAL